MTWGITIEQTQRLIDAGWQLGWRPPWEPGAPLLDSHAAINAAQAADTLAEDILVDAATHDGYISLRVPDTPPTDW